MNQSLTVDALQKCSALLGYITREKVHFWCMINNLLSDPISGLKPHFHWFELWQLQLFHPGLNPSLHPCHVHSTCFLNLSAEPWMTSPEYLTSRACPATEQAFVINNYVTECVAAAQTEKNKQDGDRKKKKESHLVDSFWWERKDRLKTISVSLNPHKQHKVSYVQEFAATAAF